MQIDWRHHMRISPDQARRASEIIAKQYGSDARIWLFGSRANDNQRGGDVDLYVEAEAVDVMRKIRCKAVLTELFDLKVDLIVGVGDKPIHRIAKTTGVRLK
jgi:predicted nucleotidyltransferase